MTRQKMTRSVSCFVYTTVTLFVLTSQPILGQVTTSNREVPAPWRPSFTDINKTVVPNQAAQAQVASNPNVQNPNSAAIPTRPAATTNPDNITPISNGVGALPNDAGQVWKEYDIRAYTSRIRTNENPEKALVDWILSETGTEMWFSQPLGILNASRDKLYVYHTPEIHKVIKPIVDRFVYRRGEVHNIEMNLVTVSKPNWRSEHYSILQPVELPTPGVEAWMVSKENAALLLGELSKRSDFQNHAGGVIQTPDGQPVKLEKRSAKQFVRSVRWLPEQVPNYQPIIANVNEGYSLEFSCLNSIDGKSMEACIECNVDQVEKLSTVKVNVPSMVGGPNQKLSLQIPQIVSWRLRERIRWPSDQVLLLNVGVVANPTPENNRPIPALLGGNPQRADALLFLEYEGPAVNPNLRHANRGGTTAVAPVLPRN